MPAQQTLHEINVFRFDPALGHEDQTIQMRRLSAVRRLILGIFSDTIYFNRDEGVWIEDIVWNAAHAPYLGLSDDAQASAILKKIDREMALKKLG